MNFKCKIEVIQLFEKQLCIERMYVASRLHCLMKSVLFHFKISLKWKSCWVAGKGGWMQCYITHDTTHYTLAIFHCFCKEQSEVLFSYFSHTFSGRQCRMAKTKLNCKYFSFNIEGQVVQILVMTQTSHCFHQIRIASIIL